MFDGETFIGEVENQQAFYNLQKTSPDRVFNIIIKKYQNGHYFPDLY